MNAVPITPAIDRPALLSALSIQLGNGGVVSDAESLAFYAHDVFAAGVALLALARPETVDEVRATVTAVMRAGAALIARGGGLSYTDGFLAVQPSVMLDLSALNRIVEINVEDRYVVVEAGVLWADLDVALAAHGLRTPYWGPLSGLRSTVGGALSQGSVFLGSGLYGSVGDSVLGLEVVTADGELLRTGSAAAGNTPAFMRYFGPDMTGLFVGDNGALGVKVRATMKLIERPKAIDFVSFKFADASTMLLTMAAVSRAGLASECFGFDPVLADIRMQRASLFADARALVSVVKQSGLLAGAKLVVAGRNFLGPESYSAHAIIEADSEAALPPRVKRVKQLFAECGKETDNSIPKAMRAMPFAPPNSMLGPSGERWVPVHGIVPHSKASSVHAACERVFAAHAESIAQHRIKIGFLFSTIAQQATLIEPVFLWPDSHTVYHKQVVDAAYQGKIGEPEDNPVTRAFVGQLKRLIADTLRQAGATHFQIGKFYDFRAERDPTALALFDAIKRQLDPHHLMNPGVLR